MATESRGGRPPGEGEADATKLKEARRNQEKESALRALYEMARAIDHRSLTDDELTRAVSLANRFEGKRGMHLRKPEYFIVTHDSKPCFATLEWFTSDDSPDDNENVQCYVVRIVTWLKEKPNEIYNIEEYRLT